MTQVAPRALSHFYSNPAALFGLRKQNPLQGLCKSIGLSNFNVEQTKEIVSMATIKPVLNQVSATYSLEANSPTLYR